MKEAVHFNLKTVLELQRSKYLKIEILKENEAGNKIYLKYCLAKVVNENRNLGLLFKSTFAIRQKVLKCKGFKTEVLARIDFWL